jgi:hypothetical protein
MLALRNAATEPPSSVEGHGVTEPELPVPEPNVVQRKEAWISGGPLPGWYVRAATGEYLRGPCSYVTAEAFLQKIKSKK